MAMKGLLPAVDVPRADCSYEGEVVAVGDVRRDGSYILFRPPVGREWFRDKVLRQEQDCPHFEESTDTEKLL